jgi:hypothetical protein
MNCKYSVYNQQNVCITRWMLSRALLIIKHCAVGLTSNRLFVWAAEATSGMSLFHDTRQWELLLVNGCKCKSPISTLMEFLC